MGNKIHKTCLKHSKSIPSTFTPSPPTLRSKGLRSNSSADEHSDTTFYEDNITPNTPPTPTLLFPQYDRSNNHKYEDSITDNTLTNSTSNTSLSEFDDSIQDCNYYNNSIIYLKNSFTLQYL